MFSGKTSLSLKVLGLRLVIFFSAILLMYTYPDNTFVYNSAMGTSVKVFDKSISLIILYKTDFV